jgi:hypothetical protein
VRRRRKLLNFVLLMRRDDVQVVCQSSPLHAKADVSRKNNFFSDIER